MIEDEPELESTKKTHCINQFIEIVKGKNSAIEEFSRELQSVLSPATTHEEHILIKNLSSVLQTTHELPASQRGAIERCLTIMTRGMMEFQRRRKFNGLENRDQLDRYCYCVAGVVGEMLTELFCDYSSEISERRKELLELSVSFGQGLQMTNILKDIWEDKQRGQCWLPRDVFDEKGFELDRLTIGKTDPRLASGIRDLVSVAISHLERAMMYVLMIPKSESGIRRFCIWALEMAIWTLRNINAHPTFTKEKEIKISRSCVKFVIASTNMLLWTNSGLNLLFLVSAYGLPRTQLSFEARSDWPAFSDEYNQMIDS